MAPSEAEIRAVCQEMADFLVAKNAAYGDSALNPVRIFSKANPIEQILVRIDDKVSRAARGEFAGEDIEWDVPGYFLLLRIARRREMAKKLAEKAEPASGTPGAEEPELEELSRDTLLSIFWRLQEESKYGRSFSFEMMHQYAESEGFEIDEYTPEHAYDIGHLPGLIRFAKRKLGK